MSQVTITRCPSCSSIISHTQEVVDALDNELGLQADVRDGAKGEFTVAVNGQTVSGKHGESLASANEVVAAVRKAAPAPMGV